MTIRYKLIPDIEHGDGSKTVFKAVRRAVDNWNGEITCIPFCDSNADYIEYKEWLDAGNTAEAAD